MNMHALEFGQGAASHVGAEKAAEPATNTTPYGPIDIDDAARNELAGQVQADIAVETQQQQSQITKEGLDNHHDGEAPLEQMVTTNSEYEIPHFTNKRPASQEPDEVMDAKRVKFEPSNGADAKRIKLEPDEGASEQQGQQPPAFAIPFPDKVGTQPPRLNPSAVRALTTLDKPAVLEERAGEIEYRVVNNDGSRESIIILTGLKCLFQKQLPKMPKDYIARLVYDRNHLSMAIVKPRPAPSSLEVVGGICYRAFRRRRFAEVVFCAISSDQQVRGYGAHLMAHLKDYVRTATSPPIMHLLTYADNYATGYFQKQGFTKDVTLARALWAGCIKDYEGGTLMQCSLLPRVRYLEAGRMLLKQRACVLAKIRPLSRSHVVHPPPAQWAAAAAGGVVAPIDPLSVPAIRATGWCPAMDELARAPRHGPHFAEMRRVLYQVQNHKQAWPFLAPVSRDDVPDYHAVIADPMDLATMEERLLRDAYAGPAQLVADMRLVFANCRRYNDAATVYSKCAVKLEKYMWTLVGEVPEWHELLDEEKKTGG
ncbi:histone acetyltransferase GCN5 [Cordyceps fumosorosea ARSEF 2679]|uniref:histone acetyltransferase n=1 Tax=Cordyceps fumosorosea (strain ARSEF 2679) TaxID=1081104 RepID=A0A167I985_CORFA|nr:histone acetyltransferase GCN5 [Cordyceps fumosorosea ARSEF 2679]OAA48814.1 histone acetyltransferase GCN5 [Cordyceps fumosorosea ARSEF 2679]